MRDELRDRLRSSFAAGRPPGGAGPAPEAASPGGAGPAPEAASPGDTFSRDFWARAERVVVPAMAEVGRFLESHGRFFSIERVAERTTCRGVLVASSVQMNVFRRHRTVNFKNGAPHFNVVCDSKGRRVLLQRTTLLAGTGPEDVGTSTLDALTRDLVQGRIAAMLDVLARG